MPYKIIMAAPMKLTRFALRRFIRRNCASQTAFYSATASDGSEGSSAGDRNAAKDPLPVFMQEDVQRLLKSMTGFDVMKLAGPQKVPLSKPKYQLLTDEELQEIQRKADSRMQYRLQMPPFMKVREPISAVLSSDPGLEGLDSSKFVFTDITFGVKDRQRLIVVREPDGTLRKASWEERDRINQIYSPLPGRQIQTPSLFQTEALERLLKKKKFVYVLDMACVQFEPDDPEFIRVTHRTYEVIDSTHSYEDLRSTRHFGGMAFYFAWYQKIDYLLVDMLNREHITDGADLVQLYCIIHPDSSIAQQLRTDHTTDTVSIVKMFCSAEASHKGQLELAIQGYEEKTRSAAAAAKS